MNKLLVSNLRQQTPQEFVNVFDLQAGWVTPREAERTPGASGCCWLFAHLVQGSRRIIGLIKKFLWSKNTDRKGATPWQLHGPVWKSRSFKTANTSLAPYSAALHPVQLSKTVITLSLMNEWIISSVTRCSDQPGGRQGANSQCMYHSASRVTSNYIVTISCIQGAGRVVQQGVSSNQRDCVCDIDWQPRSYANARKLNLSPLRADVCITQSPSRNHTKKDSASLRAAGPAGGLIKRWMANVFAAAS